MTALLIQEQSNLLLILGVVVGVVSMIIAIVKLYSDNRTNIRKQAQTEQRFKNEISNNEAKIERLEKDVEKMETRMINDQNKLISKFEQMEVRIEAKFDKLQETLISILKGE